MTTTKNELQLVQDFAYCWAKRVKFYAHLSDKVCAEQTICQLEVMCKYDHEDLIPGDWLCEVLLESKVMSHDCDSEGWKQFLLYLQEVYTDWFGSVEYEFKGKQFEELIKSYILVQFRFSK